MRDGPGERSEPFQVKLQSLERTVEKLRVLEEANAHTISQKLDQIIAALAPLGQIRDFVERVSDEHERRITALERHTAIPR